MSHATCRTDGTEARVTQSQWPAKGYGTDDVFFPYEA